MKTIGILLFLALGVSSLLPAAESRVVRISPTTNRLGNNITLEVNDLTNLLASARKDGKKLVLFVEGNELPDLTPIGSDLSSNTVTFRLERTTANKGVWAPLIKSPIAQPVRPLKFNVNAQGAGPLPVDYTLETPQLPGA